MSIDYQSHVENNNQVEVEEVPAPAPTKKIKPVPTKAGTIGKMTVDLIYGQLDMGGKWTKEMTDHIIGIVRAEFPDSAFSGTHVSYYRSVLKQNGMI